MLFQFFFLQIFWLLTLDEKKPKSARLKHTNGHQDPLFTRAY